jgi:hypothetical protein
MSNPPRAGVIQRVAGIVLALVALCLVASAPAEAQNVRFIRTNGNDANACTLTQPCRTLARGIQAAPVRGEVRLLDSGDFGVGVTIAKSLTVSGNGNTLILSGVRSGENEAVITVDDAAVRVVLRDLLLTGLGSELEGVLVSSAASMHVVGCEIERFRTDGLLAHPGAGEIFVTGSTFRNNGGNGISIFGSGTTRVIVEGSRFENNFDGASIADAQSSVTRSTFSGNEGSGLDIRRGAAGVAWSTAANNSAAGFLIDVDAQLESSVARGNGGAGLFVSGSGVPAIASISNMTVTDNGVGIQNFGTVRTRGNNRVFGNGTDFDNFGTITPLGGT